MKAHAQGSANLVEAVESGVLLWVENATHLAFIQIQDISEPAPRELRALESAVDERLSGNRRRSCNSVEVFRY
ncbi:hypothetical protein ASF33_06700 [Methylobacterium sp. Leaf92]|nr:hypothetical protein ASF33_06700 [Methylobacterium sp. Leaf92]